MWFAKVRLRLGRQLGEGEQGRVFEGLRVDPATGLRQPVAVKVLHSGTAVDLWRHEFSSLSAVRSPYCVRVLSFERVRGRPALVLEYVRGVSLTSWRAAGPTDAGDLREITAQIYAGLRDLAAQGSYHGDLSPNNVMIDDRGVIRLLDFGLANGAGDRVRCTPEFAAPERRLGLPPDVASDLYSLGCLVSYLGDQAPPGALLDPDPSRRMPPTETPDPARAAVLAARVNALLARDQRGRAVRTEGCPAARTGGRVVRALAPAVAALLLSLPSPESLARPGFGTLAIATSAWCEVRVDGRPHGFAPVRLPLTSREAHVIECTGPEGPKRVRVTLKPGERRRLRDRDFSHHSSH